MSLGYWIVKGDKTSCGGTVLEGHPNGRILGGNRQATSGCKVSCGKHSGTYSVGGGHPGDLIHGQRAASTLYSRSTCPCNALFIPSITWAKHGLYQGGENKDAEQKLQYTVTIYTAYPGTPLNNKYGVPNFDKEGNRVVSEAGHMWLQIKKINEYGIEKDNISYGFAPITSGITGDGAVTNEDTIHYENPYYSRTIEITKQQYDKIYEFGDLAMRKNQTYFNLYYNGVTNSCIDFTWKALRHAGITPTQAWNDLSRYNKEQKKAGEFDGDLKVINNIPHIKSIPAPFPDSKLNTQKYNEKPPRTIKQWLLSQNENKPYSNNIELAKK